MNKKKMILWLLPVIQLVITVVALTYLPKKIPIHFNFHGEIDRLGGKYELFILVMIPIIQSVLLQREIKKTCKYPTKDEEPLKRNNMLYWIGITVNAIFLSITCVLII
ncbi:hypothetical protein M2454_002831 [Aequitasia blattaphilus]|uniref:DUF1648 domain-containing protein n=1 Tax=Aequitasia blattaphilus TaxID=2949332 RepID=A0ABT1ECE0_9FIRM|nr:DUF1648 domain-containing protein [Aequitasia blattaphilus]MCP1103499.1 DUF1648 domain-containing protein [Aequitasia blattaphilus]MCR8616139.1 DUF1648 domain-containing protein [Aequitasia blattaphilus]